MISDYCKLAGPIFYDSIRDTPETVKEIENHNLVWSTTCEEKPGG